LIPAAQTSEPKGKEMASNRVSCFCISDFPRKLARDQKAIWMSPLHFRASDLYWLAPATVGTAALVAGDDAIMRHVRSTPAADSNSLSNYALATMIAANAGIYFSGVRAHDDRRREAGFLAGEAAVNSAIVAEAMKVAFERPRPDAAQAGNFGAGGASFPSEHAFVAWSIASVMAQEYPGPLTKLLAYGTAAGISDSLDVMRAVLCGSLVFFLILHYGLRLNAFPLSIYALEALLTFTLLAGVRVLSRLLVETARVDLSSKRLLLLGAGHAAQAIIRETRRENRALENDNGGARNETRFRVIGCLDDDPLKKDLRVMGVPVFGPAQQLAEVVAREHIDEILIAIPTATPQQMLRLVAHCKHAGLPFRTVPAMSELISGRVTLQQVRDVSLPDLLGRIPVDLDLESVRTHIQGRVVLVTGAAGSIGSELCRQIRAFRPKLLVCLDQNETGIFHLQNELAKVPDRDSIFASTAEELDDHGQKTFCVADFCNGERMRRIFLTYGVEIVFHAAAYKHVPVMESNVEEAVNNNILGLLSLLNVAQNSNCSTFVMISSDKAVNPTNVMGCTKRVGELMLAAWPGEKLRCVSVRFGNVLGSNGSVIPLFQEQIRRNQAITITHPDITRFFMTISEAVSLVLQAFAIGRKGEILVLDMGEPVRVVELATTLARLSGKSHPQLKFIGLRPGEKLFEELFYPEERVLPSACAKIACAEGVKLSWPALKRNLDELYVALSLGRQASILARLRQIVPQFNYAGCDQEAARAEILAPGTKSEAGSRDTAFTGLTPANDVLTEIKAESKEEVESFPAPRRPWPLGSTWQAVDGTGD
jgi:FlaA1/EpsC-like NDP-sugar epimerase